MRPIADGDHDRGQGGRWQVLEEVRRDQQQQRDGERAYDTRQLRTGARCLGHRRSR